MGRPSFSPPPKKQRLHVYSWQGKVGCVFPQTINHLHNSFPHPITFWTRLMFNFVRVGKEWACPVFSHPLKSKGYMCIHDRVRLAVFFRRRLTICTTVFPHPITFWTRLMFNLVKVGKEWAGPVFPHPLTSRGYMCIHDRVRLAVFYRRRLTICTTVFSYQVTFWIRLMFNHVRVGKEGAGPVFPHPLTSNFVLCVFWTGYFKTGCVFPHPINQMHNSFSPRDNLCIRLMFNLVRVGKEWASPVFPHPLKSKGYMCIHDRVRLAVFFRRRLTICTTVFPHPITFWRRLMFNFVRVGKNWASPVFSHSLTSKGYMCIHDRVRLAVFFRRRLTICTTVFSHPVTFRTRLMFNLVRVGKEWAGPVFPHP